ncbi:MAG: DUF2851 family protein, partial [Planctomycetota bacterium]
EAGAFLDLYGRLLEEFAGQIGERESSYGQAARSVREEIVRCVWFGGHFRSEGLATDDGRRIEVLSPGWWNVEGGPDFVRAEFLLEGAGRVVGDVEVHTASSSWYAHGHHKQPEYSDVALHVVMWSDRDEHGVQSKSGRTIPQLTLSKAVEEDLEELVEIVDPESEAGGDQWPAVEGRYCGQAYGAGDMDPQWLGGLLDAAGNHRILTRAASIGELLENHPREQVLYERLAEALGYKSNRMPFLQLAGLLPAEELRRSVPAEANLDEKSRMLEAAYFTVGGFLDGDPDAVGDPETKTYCKSLRDAWAQFSPGLAAAKLSEDHWRFGGTRPDNYPTRRIAALARLCAAHLHTGLFKHFLHTVNTVTATGRQQLHAAIRTALLNAFQSLEHPYWSWRYSFTGRRLSRPRALVGQERALSILVDVLVPTLLAHAQVAADSELTARLNELWQGMPRRQENAVTRRMEQVVFDSQEEARRVVHSARRQQGLHQLYKDSCRAEGGCERCVVYLARAAGKSVSPL